MNFQWYGFVLTTGNGSFIDQSSFVISSTLSNSIHAISALLYPFEWQHAYIPVLPRNMLDVVCAPTPYIIGLLSTSLPDVQDLPMEEVNK